MVRVLGGTGGCAPLIEYVAEAEQCSVCAAALNIRNTRHRQVITLEAGAFEVKETLKHCGQDPSHPVAKSQALAQLIKPHQGYGYDLIVYVGCARYLENKQREEIRAELYEQRGIELSTGSVSNLCDRFLSHLEALHLARVAHLRTAMHEGYPLHIDATCEHGKGGLFVCMDGWRGWVLVAGRVPSEHEHYLRPFIEKTLSLFGHPIATVRDMGEGGARAVSLLREQGIPDLICHYHFLAAVGKQLFEPSYRLLRNLLKRSQLRTDMRLLLRELRRYDGSSQHNGRFGRGQVREDLQALVLWCLEGEGKKDLLYPFGLAHLEFVQRCRQALFKAQGWVPEPRTPPERRAIGHLSSLINRLEQDNRLNTATTRLEKAWLAFCELRDVLALTNEELPRADLRQYQQSLPAIEAQRLQTIEKAVQEYQAELRERVTTDDDENAFTPSPSTIILKYLDRYTQRLFGHPSVRDEDGHIQAIVERTNNVLEHFFGDEKQHLRRRLGRAHLGRDLENQPAQAALAANLRHPDYVHLLCGCLDNLPRAFATIDEQALEKTTDLIRTNRDSKLLGRIHTLLKSEIPAKAEPMTQESNRFVTR